MATSEPASFCTMNELPWSKKLALSRGMCCLEDIDLIYSLLQGAQEVVIVGAGSGTMSLAFLEMCDKLAFLTSIDTDVESLEWEKRAWKASGWGEKPNNARQILADSGAFGLHWPKDRPIDLLIIDGDHSYDGVSRDLKVWLPHVASGGAILLHDYDSPALDSPNNSPAAEPNVKEVADILITEPKWTAIARQGWSKAWRRSKPAT